MNREQLLTAMQHTPLPERMSNFERTRSPQEPMPLADGSLLIVEYSHLAEDVRFQVIARDENAVMQIARGPEVTPVSAVTVEEAGHMLRRDLLMILEDLEDDL